MANNVFANGRELACKAGSGKTIAAFPDVCFTPPDKVPPTPLGIPIPYPNFAKCKHTHKGSKSVKISGKPVTLKNKSFFKKSNGNEPAKPTQKKGLLTSKVKGKAYFTSWSMNVKVEKKNVVRHMDMTTHNHGSFPGNSPPWAFFDSAATKAKVEAACKKDQEQVEAKCEGKDTIEAQCKDDECRNARACVLRPYSKGVKKSKKEGTQINKVYEEGSTNEGMSVPANVDSCCPGDQPHHLVEAHSFYKEGESRSKANLLKKFKSSGYSAGKAPCVCAAGDRFTAEHGDLHGFQGKAENKAIDRAKNKEYAWTYKEAKAAGVKAHQDTFKNSKCTPGCIEATLDAYHKDKCKIKENTKLRTTKAKLTEKQKKGVGDEKDISF